MILKIRTRGLIAGTPERFEPPATAEAAKRFAEEMNRQNRQERAQRESARRGLLDRARLRSVASISHDIVRISPSAVYAERRPRAERDPEKQPSPAPRRPRTFGELASQVYSTRPPEGADLIRTGQRGGR